MSIKTLTTREYVTCHYCDRSFPAVIEIKLPDHLDVKLKNRDEDWWTTEELEIRTKNEEEVLRVKNQCSINAALDAHFRKNGV